MVEQSPRKLLDATANTGITVDQTGGYCPTSRHEQVAQFQEPFQLSRVAELLDLPTVTKDTMFLVQSKEALPNFEIFSLKKGGIALFTYAPPLTETGKRKILSTIIINNPTELQYDHVRMTPLGEETKDVKCVTVQIEGGRVTIFDDRIETFVEGLTDK